MDVGVATFVRITESAVNPSEGPGQAVGPLVLSGTPRPRLPTRPMPATSLWGSIATLRF